MSNLHKNDSAPLTDRINAEPAILRGLSSTEALIAIGLSFACWLPLSLLIGFIVHYMVVSVVFLGAGPIASVWLLSGWFQKVKRDRPDFYYQHLFKKQLARLGLMSSRYTTQSGVWDLGRSIPALRKPGLLSRFIRLAGQ
jgi:conjugative transfer region protein (TIGR03750 family)